MTTGKLEIQKSTLPLILFGVVLLFWLNSIPAVHGVFIAWDTNVAVAANSLLGVYPSLDQTIGWINTRLGDAVVLTLMAAIFIAHSLSASTFTQVVERLSFWWWVAILCIITYLLVCITAQFYCHPIPLLGLQRLHDVGSVYQIPLRSSAFNSYPSGHGLAYVFFALMAWYKRYNGVSLFILAVGAIMLSMRVILGLHWLSDIFLGALPLSLVLSSAAFDTPLKRTYDLFYSATYYLLAQITGQPWLFERLAASKHQQQCQLPSWSRVANYTDSPSPVKSRVLQLSGTRGRHSPH